MNPVHYLSEPAKHAIDLTAGATLIATILSWLPGITVILSFVWIIMRIVESRQVQKINAQQIELNARKLREK